MPPKPKPPVSPKDPYFIASVPMYRDFRAEVDPNDSIGDRFFDDFEGAIENTSPRPAEEAKTENEQQNAVPKIAAKSRPTTNRRSVSVAAARVENLKLTDNKPAPAAPFRPWNLRSSRNAAAASSSHQQPPAPAPAAAPPQPARHSTVNAKPTVVQPPMRFGNTSRRSVMIGATPNMVEQPARHSTVNAKPTIVQPPMRFGNTSRRSVMTGATPNMVEPPSRVSVFGRGAATAAKTAAGETVQAKPRPISRRSLAKAVSSADN